MARNPNWEALFAIIQRAKSFEAEQASKAIRAQALKKMRMTKRARRHLVKAESRGRHV